VSVVVWIHRIPEGLLGVLGMRGIPGSGVQHCSGHCWSIPGIGEEKGREY
jgi:hypothetical protein